MIDETQLEQFGHSQKEDNSKTKESTNMVW